MANTMCLNTSFKAALSGQRDRYTFGTGAGQLQLNDGKDFQKGIAKVATMDEPSIFTVAKATAIDLENRLGPADSMRH